MLQTRGAPARGTLTVLWMLFLAGCGRAGEEGDSLLSLGGGETLFFTQTVVPDAVMDALFQGRVSRDVAGCLRLDLDDRHTVIWPKGFSLDRRPGHLVVLDAGGDAVGRIGGHFRLGGGEVPFLHAGIPLSDADRERAEARCPGRYWIVGEVP